MHKLENGYWCPDRFEGSRFLQDLLPNGLPSYNSALIKETVRQCGHRKITAIDGGAFIGTWSLHLMRYFEKLIAFEPIEENYHCLVKNLNGPYAQGTDAIVTIINKALSNTDEPLQFEPGDKNKPFSWHAIKEFFVPQIDKKLGPTVKAITLDALTLPDVDLIKLDVEGHECEAIHGAMETIKYYKPVIVIEEKHDDRKKASKLLKSIGMTPVYKDKNDYIFTWK